MASSITIANFAAGRIFQRAAGTNTSWYDGTCTITFSGTYVGTAPTSLQITVNSINYTGGSFSASAGSWSCTAPISNGDGYVATVTELATGTNNIQTNTGTNAWGVGILIGLIGQSNMSYFFSTIAGVSLNDGHSRVTGNGSSWSTYNYDGLATMVNVLRGAMGTERSGNTTPLGFFCNAIGGTSVTSWQSGQSSWNAFASAISAAGGDMEYVLWHQGEADDQAGGTDPAVLSGVGYQSLLQNVVSQCQSAVSGAGRSSSQIKFGVAVIGNYSEDNPSTGTSPAYLDKIHTYQLAVAAQANCFMAATLCDVIHAYGGQEHYLSGSFSTYPRFGYRFAASVGNQMGLAAYPYGAGGPKITSASWPVGSNQITINVTQFSGGTSLQLGNNGATSGSIAQISSSFGVTSSGGQTISSGSFSGNTITLTMSAVRGSGDTGVGLYYSAGNDPFLMNDAYSVPPYNSNATWSTSILFDNRQSYLQDPGDSEWPTYYGGPSGFPLQPTSGGAASPITLSTGPAINAVFKANLDSLSSLSAVANVNIDSQGAATNIVPGTGSMSFTGLGPGVEPRNLTPGAGHMTFNGLAPFMSNGSGGGNLLLLGVGS